MDVCRRCGSQDIASIWRSSRNNYETRCRVCHRNYRRKWAKLDRIKHPGKYSSYAKVYRAKVRREHGTTTKPSQLYRLLAKEQGDRCAICRSKEKAMRNGKVKRLCMDHNHRNGKVRGLLCRECNWALGGFRDSSRLLRLAADYLDGY